MSSRRKSSTPCMVRPVSDPPDQNHPEEEEPMEEVPVEELPMEEPAEVPMSAEDVGLRPVSSPDPEEENSEPQQQEERWGPERWPPSPDNHEATLEPSEQKEAGPEGGEDAAMDAEDDDEEDEEEEEQEEEEEEEEEVEDEGDSETTSQKTQSRGYVCKYCSFSTLNLADFKAHVDAHHPNVILNPLYLCAVCNFSTKKFDSLTDHNEGQHPGETNFKFKRVMMDHQTVLQQTIEGPVTVNQEESAFPPRLSATLQMPGSIRPLYETTKPNGFLQNDHITAVNINGTVIIPEPSAVQGPAHVSPLLQRPPNFSSIPKIAVPLNTTKYNPSLDTNMTLMSSFNKFPYPTHAELSWLTAASRHPEEQIKVWFTAQRLKQGITWAPEEVEEARKKMFNGSIPPAHHTFTVLPPGPTPPSPPGPASSTESPPLGLHTQAGSSPPSRVSVCSSYAVVRPLVEQTESKRPVMAVAPHSGDAKDKGLMAPPPPPPPLKDRPPVPMEMKRPVATPLVTTDIKRKNLGVAVMPSPSSRGQAAQPSMVFPRRYIAPPPPIIAPPYKNYLIPHPSSLTPPVLPQTKRPSIIQPPRATRPPTQPPSSPSYSHKLKEQQGRELKAPSPRGDKVLTPLSEANGVPRDLNLHNNGVLQLNGGGEPAALQKCPVPTQFPLLERMKGKTAEQLKILEENFLRNSFPTHGDVDTLAAAARLSRQEIRSWFLERRALRDDLEQALLNAMGTKRPGSTQGFPGADRRQQHQTLQLNGIHKPRSGSGGGHIRSPPPPTSQVPIVAPSTPSTVLPDSRAPPKDDRAPTRWPSPEEMSQLEARTGLPRSDLLRWFTDSRLTLKNSGSELAQLFHKMGGAGGAGPIGGQQGGRGNPLLENVPNMIQRCRESGAKSNGTAAAPEANASRIAENYASSLGSQHHHELQDWFSSRLRQHSSLEMKSGGGGGAGGRGAGEVLGGWMENGHVQRELPLHEHQQKLEG